MYRIRTTPFVSSEKAGAPVVMGGSQQEPVIHLEAGEGVSIRATALARAAWTSERLGLLERAVQLYGKALEEVEAKPKAVCWKLSVLLRNNLAAVMRRMGQIEQAEAHYIAAINLLETRSEQAAADLRRTLMMNLADLYHCSGFEQQAQALVAGVA
jgi:tetratricopeptide (TPR) repeat protein